MPKHHPGAKNTSSKIAKSKKDKLDAAKETVAAKQDEN